MTAEAPALYATFWTISGDTIPGMSSEVSPSRFPQPGRGGAEGWLSMALGLSIADYIALRETIGVPEMKAILADNGIPLIEFEVAVRLVRNRRAPCADPTSPGATISARQRSSARCTSRSSPTSSTHVDDAWSLDHFAGEFRKLCDDAANVGTRVALELLPFSNIKTPKQGQALVEAAGAKNGGLNVDIWHMERGNIPFSEVAALPE